MNNSNKVLVSLSVPEIDETFDILIPISRKVGNVIELINKILEENTKGKYKGSKTQNLYNRITGERYNINLLVIETNIRNGTQIVLI